MYNWDRLVEIRVLCEQGSEYVAMTFLSWRTRDGQEHMQSAYDLIMNERRP